MGITQALKMADLRNYRIAEKAPKSGYWKQLLPFCLGGDLRWLNHMPFRAKEVVPWHHSRQNHAAEMIKKSFKDSKWGRILSPAVKPHDHNWLHLFELHFFANFPPGISAYFTTTKINENHRQYNICAIISISIIHSYKNFGSNKIVKPILITVDR